MTNEEIATKIVQDICELPGDDHDGPDLLMVTTEELRLIVLRALDDCQNNVARFRQIEAAK